MVETGRHFLKENAALSRREVLVQDGNGPTTLQRLADSVGRPGSDHAQPQQSDPPPRRSRLVDRRFAFAGECVGHDQDIFRVVQSVPFDESVAPSEHLLELNRCLLMHGQGVEGGQMHLVAEIAVGRAAQHRHAQRMGGGSLEPEMRRTERGQNIRHLLG